MAAERFTCLLLSDFTIQNLALALTNDPESPLLEPIVAPFDQVAGVLLDENHDLWRRTYDAAVIWTRPEGISSSFNSLLSYEQVDRQVVLDDVDRFTEAVKHVSSKARCGFLPLWVIPHWTHGYGMLDRRPGVGIADTLAVMNSRLAENLADQPNLFVLDTQKWVARVGRQSFNPKLWYMGKIAFGNEVFTEAVHDIKGALHGISGQAKKLVIVDLDDTLWGGIVGDDGWENLKLGGHDFVGEAYADFQRALRGLTNRGVLLGIVSKNESETALEAIKKHPEMVLSQDDFAGWRINWNDKAQNIVDLVDELNLGLQSVVFIDDNPVERARVRETLPEVLVPELPEDKLLFASFIRGLRCFDAPSLSQEDAHRSRMYVSERKRRDLKTSVGSYDDWLRSLEITIKVEKLSSGNIARTTQLLNKTNQMNLSTRRMTESELLEWTGKEGRVMWTFRVADKFGDAGLTGIISLEKESSRGRIADFVLSCRVMGRKVEETMLAVACHEARRHGLESVYAEFIPTPKNKPCFDFWMRSGCDFNKGANRFSWPLEREYEFPSEVNVVRDDE